MGSSKKSTPKVGNEELAKAMQELRRSNAAGVHDPRPHRQRSRKAARDAAIGDYRRMSKGSGAFKASGPFAFSEQKPTELNATARHSTQPGQSCRANAPRMWPDRPRGSAPSCPRTPTHH